MPGNSPTDSGNSFFRYCTYVAQSRDDSRLMTGWRIPTTVKIIQGRKPYEVSLPFVRVVLRTTVHNKPEAEVDVHSRDWHDPLFELTSASPFCIPSKHAIV
jgi:hypothetical protein